MKKAFSVMGLTLLYVLVCVAPLSFMFDGQLRGRPFMVELSVALGFVGLSMMGLQFVLVSRAPVITEPFGMDFLFRFHKEVGVLALLFILAHPIILVAENTPKYLPLFFVQTAPWRARFALASTALLLLLIGLSIWRRRLRMPYELWQVTHSLMAIGIVVLAILHANGVGYYTAGVARRTLFDAMAGSLVGVQVWMRFVAPLMRLFRPWRIVRVERERGRSTTIVVEPVGHSGFSFKPGQFAWISRFPFAFSQHPFSISSPSDAEPRGRIAVTIKALGDWTKKVGSLKEGRHIYLDGPHGEFSMDLFQAPGYVFIAGGVGITPLFSMISTMYVREDVRPVILFYASPNWDGILLREQLEELAGLMPNLQLVHVLKEVPNFWRGESGRLNAALMTRYLPPKQYQRYEYFICGSESMMDSVERELAYMEVSEERIHSERFAMV